jgi:hypothetical protein
MDRVMDTIRVHERLNFQSVDPDAGARHALACLARLWSVPEEGTLEQRKEFLRGFVHEIAIDPDTARGTITFYELPVTSLMSVPGARVQLLETFPSKRLDGFRLPAEAWRVAA